MAERDLLIDSRALSRAGALGTISGIAATAFLGWRGRRPATAADGSGSSPPACVITPSEDEGPYFVDERLDRSNLTTGTSRPSVVDGTPLALTFAISSVTAGICSPLAGAYVDLWHADASGIYSDLATEDTAGETFLRGYQITDENGVVAFRTIYPGWYPGRAIHVHVKVRTFSLSGSTAHQFTSQLFLDDTLSDAVMSRAPYNTRGRRDTLNAGDPLYKSALQLALQRTGLGVAGTYNLGVRMS